MKPFVLVPLAEKCGLLLPVDDHNYTKGCFFKVYSTKGGGPLNLSGFRPIRLSLYGLFTTESNLIRRNPVKFSGPPPFVEYT